MTKVSDPNDTADFFTDPTIAVDPYRWYEQVSDRGPVWREPHHGVVMVTGMDQVKEVLSDAENWSSCLAVTGPFPGLPEQPTGDDASAIIAKYRDQMPMSEHLITFDTPEHTRHRSLLLRLLTPRRLKENEAFVRRLADEQLDPLIARGSVELLKDYASNFAMLVVADLLGVPEEDHIRFRAQLGTHTPGEIGSDEEPSLNFLEDYFTPYIESRRENPRDDVLSALATATFPDGETPTVRDVVLVSTFLFGAGQETSARLIVSASHYLAEHQDVQQQLREDPSRIADVVEEFLRLESPVKSTFRVAIRSTTLGGVEIPAGTLVACLLGAANRDAERVTCPARFDIEREDLYQHVAFGRGPHACPGGALARLEARVTLEQMLAKTEKWELSEEHHGPPGARRLDYDLTYILRGLGNLHLTFTPKAASCAAPRSSPERPRASAGASRRRSPTPGTQ